jgi:hypothetical protein
MADRDHETDARPRHDVYGSGNICIVDLLELHFEATDLESSGLQRRGPNWLPCCYHFVVVGSVNARAPRGRYVTNDNVGTCILRARNGTVTTSQSKESSRIRVQVPLMIVNCRLGEEVRNRDQRSHVNEKVNTFDSTNNGELPRHVSLFLHYPDVYSVCFCFSIPTQ